jgi:hypothetical protein
VGENARDDRGSGLKQGKGLVGTPKEDEITFCHLFDSIKRMWRGQGGSEVGVNDTTEHAGVGTRGTKWEDGC